MKPVTFKVDLAGSQPNKPPVKAYVFDDNKQLLSVNKVKEGKVSLPLDDKTLQHSRIMLAPFPPTENGIKEISPDAVKNRQAFEPYGNVLDKLQITIPEDIWKHWLFKSCLVKGRITKPIFQNGTRFDFPVCNARVHICEVDRIRWKIPLIPLDILRDIRDVLEKLPDPKFEINLPEIGPRPLPDPVPDFRRPVFENGRVSFSNTEKANTAKALKNTQILPILNKENFEEAKKYFGTNEQKLVIHPDLLKFRDNLIQHWPIVYPILCYYHYFWPYFFTCEEKAVVVTDHSGNYEATVYTQIFDTDQPDIYIWVEYQIGDEWVTVYKPPIPCNTYWNYDCITPIDISIYHPAVETCGSLPGTIVKGCEMLSIGNSVRFKNVTQSMTATETLGDTLINSVGLGRFDSETKNLRPLASTLGLRVNFGALTIDGGCTHFRWSYRKIRNKDLGPVTPADATWKVIDKQVVIRYKEEKVIPGPGGGELKFFDRNFVMGPYTIDGGTYFRVPPKFAQDLETLGYEPNPDNLVRYWVHETFNSALLDTLFSGDTDIDRENDAGLYELKLEFFKAVSGSGGTTITQQKLSEDFFQFDTEGDTSIDVAEENKLKIGTDLFGYKMKIRIDNAHCYAKIHDIQVNTDIDSTKCGVLRYDEDDDDAKLSFTASHPRHFAVYNFTVRRGTCGLVPGTNESGAVINSNPVYSLTAGKFNNTFEIGDLMSPIGSCGGCDSAAFAERLYVTALATNGLEPFTALDASNIAGFALIKEEPPTP